MVCLENEIIDESNLNDVDFLTLLLNNRRQEILDNLYFFRESFQEYMPDQFFSMSVTYNKINNLENLSRNEVSKLSDIFELAVLNNEFDKFYSLDVENEYTISDIILEFDIDFWNDIQNCFEIMVQKFKSLYGINKVDSIL